MPSYIYNMVDTWNAGATTFTAIKMNVTDTASAAASLLMDLQVGGASKFKVQKNGDTTTENITSRRFIGLNNNASLSDQDNTLYMSSGFRLSWSSSNASGTQDLFLTRRAAANLRFGAADAAAPVAQTLSVQSVVAGTTNTAGANLTITGSQGTGTGAGGSIIFQVAPAGSSGTAQNALDTALTIASNKSVTFAGLVSGITYLAIQPTGYTNGLLLYDTGSGPSLALTSNGDIRWSSSSTNAGSTADVLLARDAANTLAQRNGTNAQTFRVYHTLTGSDVSASGNYERARLEWSGNELRFGTEAGTGGGTLRSMGLYIGNTRYQIIGGNFNQFDQPIYMNTTGIATGSGASGFKIGTATTQGLGFWNATPSAQPAAVADATDAASVITQLNELLARLRTIGLIAT